MKVLFYDIETSPLKVWTFSIGSKVSIPYSAIVKGSKQDIICVSWKWGHESTVHSMDWGFKKQDSSKLVKKLTQEMEKADLIIGHNADKFDWRHLNTQRMLHKLPSIDWSIRSEDTLKQLRKHFYLPSYRLDYIASLLEVGSKNSMCFQDWIDIVERRDESKLRKMVKYCSKDVLLLQSVYTKLKPYMKPKLEYAVLGGGYVCPVCGSGKVVKNGVRVYNGKIYQNYICKNHGGYAGKKLVGKC